MFAEIGQATEGIYILLGLAFLMGIACALLTKVRNKNDGGFLYVFLSLVCGIAPILILPGAVLTAGAFFLGVVFIAFSLTYYKRHYILDIHGVTGQFIMFVMFLSLSIMYNFEPIQIPFYLSHLTMLILFAVYAFIDNVTTSADIVSEANKLDYSKHIKLSSMKFAVYMIVFTIISLPFVFIDLGNPFKFTTDNLRLQREDTPQTAWEVFGQMFNSGVLIWLGIGIVVLLIMLVLMKRIARTKPRT
jgi:hypothetical protein